MINYIKKISVIKIATCIIIVVLSIVSSKVIAGGPDDGGEKRPRQGSWKDCLHTPTDPFFGAPLSTIFCSSEAPSEGVFIPSPKDIFDPFLTGLMQLQFDPEQNRAQAEIESVFRKIIEDVIKATVDTPWAFLSENDYTTALVLHMAIIMVRLGMHGDVVPLLTRGTLQNVPINPPTFTVFSESLYDWVVSKILRNKEFMTIFVMVSAIEYANAVQEEQQGSYFLNSAWPVLANIFSITTFPITPFVRSEVHRTETTSSGAVGTCLNIACALTRVASDLLTPTSSASSLQHPYSIAPNIIMTPIEATQEKLETLLNEWLPNTTSVVPVGIKLLKLDSLIKATLFSSPRNSTNTWVNILLSDKISMIDKIMNELAEISKKEQTEEIVLMTQVLQFITIMAHELLRQQSHQQQEISPEISSAIAPYASILLVKKELYGKIDKQNVPPSVNTYLQAKRGDINDIFYMLSSNDAQPSQDNIYCQELNALLKKLQEEKSQAHDISTTHPSPPAGDTTTPPPPSGDDTGNGAKRRVRFKSLPPYSLHNADAFSWYDFDTMYREWKRKLQNKDNENFYKQVVEQNIHPRIVKQKAPSVILSIHVHAPRPSRHIIGISG